MKKILSILAALLVLSPLVASATLRVVQTPTLYLYAGESAAATTMRITPYPRDLDGTKLTITDFGDTPTLTIDPKVFGIEEIESFTGITDNGDNTATLTGLSRNLVSKYPYTTAGTGRTHGSGATVVFGNNPQLYGRLAAKENNETIPGNWTFTGTATFSNFPITPSNGTSTINTAGVVQLATSTQLQNSTATSTNGTNAPLVISAGSATSTYNAATAVGVVPVTKANGAIDLNFLGTTTIALPATTTTAYGLTVTATSSLTVGAFPAWQIGKQSQIFSTGGATTTFSVPSGITRASVTVVGGGCTGGGTTTGNSASGGGAGGTAIENVDVSGTTTIQLYVGAACQWSTFGTNGFYLSASPGSVGAAGAVGGVGGIGSGGDLNMQGGDGGASGPGTGSSSSSGGIGGSSTMGGGGSGASPGASAGVAGVAGRVYGGGGGGASAGSGSGASGGTGAQGIVIVRW